MCFTKSQSLEKMPKIDTLDAITAILTTGNQSSRYAQDMPPICPRYQKKIAQIGLKKCPTNAKISLIYAQYMPKICRRDAQDMSKICLRYPQDIPEICPRCAHDAPKICPRYAQDIPKICPRAKICPRYAQDISIICERYQALFDKISKTLIT